MILQAVAKIKRNNDITLFTSDSREEQTQADYPGWTAGQRYIAYGLRFGLRANDPAALALVAPYLPLGWQAAPTAR